MVEAEQITELQSDPAPAEPDDFDRLLAEFTNGTAQQTEQTDPVDQDLRTAAAERDRAFAANLNAITENLQLDSKRAELQAGAQALQQEVDRRDAAAAIETIRGSLPAEMFGNEMIDSWITWQATKNPAIYDAWQGRHADPRAYERTLHELAGEFGDKFRRFQTADEIDHAAVAHAVRSGSAPVGAEPPPAYGRMSDAEFAAEKRRLGIE